MAVTEAPHSPVAAPARKGRFQISELNRRRLQNFARNRRAYWSLIIFSVLFTLSLFAEFLAYDKPIVVQYRGSIYTPVFQFYPETEFGGDFKTEAVYGDIEVQCLILSGGLEECWDDPEAIVAGVKDGSFGEGVEGFYRGRMLWPLIPYSYDTTVDTGGVAPGRPNVIEFYLKDDAPSVLKWLPRLRVVPEERRGHNLLGVDDTSRDVLARVIHGFRLSIMYTLIVTVCASAIGIVAGALQGYFGGWLDLIFQRILEIWSSTPSLYVIIIMFAIFERSFWMLVFLSVLFGWPALVGVVRAEFLRARNFEYVRAAKALGVSDWVIMFRHMLPNAMVATLTLLPFIITGTIGSLAALDFIGFGLPSAAPSLGELSKQAKDNLHAPWLAFTAFFTFAIMLSLLVFIFEGVRDAFDPRKTFR